MIALYDFFPTIWYLVLHVPLVPGANHGMFPRILIYDASAIPESLSTPVELRAETLGTRVYGNYIIPTTSPIHYRHLYSKWKHTAQIIESPAHQFSLIQVIGSTSDETILIRQGNHLLLFGEVWRLVLVILE